MRTCVKSPPYKTMPVSAASATRPIVYSGASSSSAASTGHSFVSVGTPLAGEQVDSARTRARKLCQELDESEAEVLEKVLKRLRFEQLTGRSTCWDQLCALAEGGILFLLQI